ncbi:MAG: CDP-alcohol phosphatidyltransferase family protein [bacterium]|nr:CDP-alcohol phosphatidyltransferase family protein [bacterium]
MRLITYLPYFKTAISYGTRRQNIPNIITTFRLVFCFPFIAFETMAIFFEQPWFHIPGLVALLLCLPSDKLDGFLARRYGWITDWGKKWDPIIDAVVIGIINVFTAVVIVAMFGWIWGIVYSILVFLVIVRNGIVSQGFKYLHERAKNSDSPDVQSMVEKVSHVTDWGKWSTAIQMTAIFCFFVLKDSPYQAITFTVVFVIGFSFSMISGVDYGIKGVSIARVLWQKENFPKQREARYLFKTLTWVKSILARAIPF